MSRQRITITSDIEIYSGLRTVTIFMAGAYRGDSLRDAILSQLTDCTHGTRVILDGRDIGSLFQLGVTSQ